MATIANIAIGLTANTGGFESGMKRAVKRLDDFKSGASRTVPAIKEIAKAMDVTKQTASRFAAVFRKQVKLERDVTKAIKATQRARRARHAELRSIIARKRRILANESKSEALSVKRFKTAEMQRKAIRAKSQADSVSRFNAVAVAALATAAAVVAVGVAFARMIGRSIESIDILEKTSQKLGVTTEALSVLRFAGTQTGVSIQTVDLALQRFTRRLSEAAIGTGEAQGALRELGVDARKLNKLGSFAALKVIAEKLKKVENQSDKVRLAFKLFDSEGVAFINLLSGGAAGLDKMAKSSNRLGATISTLGAKDVALASDALGRMGTVMQGIANSLTISLSPAITEVANSITEDLVNAFQRLETSPEAIKTITSAVRAMGAVVKTTVQVFDALFIKLQQISKFVESNKAGLGFLTRGVKLAASIVPGGGIGASLGESLARNIVTPGLDQPELKQDTQEQILEVLIETRNQMPTAAPQLSLTLQ